MTGSEHRVAAYMRALEEERRYRQLHADARTAEAMGAGGAFRMLVASGLVPVETGGRLAVVLPPVPIRGPGHPGYFETRFIEDAEALNCNRR